MRILVTGGAGFIGSNFIHRTVLQRPDTQITVLDKLTYAANPDNLTGLDRFDVELVEGDVCDTALVDRLVRETDLVVHFAAESHNDNSLRDPMSFVRSNVEGTVALLDAAVAHDVRFHHISTDEVFGDLALDDPARFTPQTPYAPSSPYSASKAASDHFVRSYVRSLGLRATISNCSNNYGPRQHPEKFIPRQIINLLHGQPPRVYGTGDNIRDWIHVDDHNDAVWAVIDRGEIGWTYLIGADGERSNLQVVGELNELFGRDRDDFVQVTDRPGHDRRYAIDPASIRQLGWEPAHADFSDGLRATVDWYRDNPGWWADSRAAAEAVYRTTEREL